MALKAKIKKSAFEKLSDELKKEYKVDADDDSNYNLEVDGLEDTGSLKRAKDREQQRAKEAEEERDSLREQVSKLEKGKAGDVVKLQTKYERDTETLKTQHTEALSKRDGFITKSLTTGLAERISAALNPKAPKVFVPHIEKRISVDLTGDEPKIVILGADGKASALTPETLQAEFVANKDFAGMIVGSKASGGAGATKTGSGAPARSQNNEDQQPPSLHTMNPRALADRIKADKEAKTQDA